MRITPIVPGTRPELAEIERAIRAARGGIPTLYQVLLASPPVAEGWERLLTAIRQRTAVPPDLRELVILRIAVLNRAGYEFEAHVPHALAAGVTQEKIAALRGRDALNQLTPVERLVIELADAMTRDIEVPDALWERLRAQFDDQQLVELVATVASYNMVSRLLVALCIEPGV
jgi:AhpD family alkylhydroperoxidase